MRKEPNTPVLQYSNSRWIQQPVPYDLEDPLHPDHIEHLPFLLAYSHKTPAPIETVLSVEGYAPLVQDRTALFAPNLHVSSGG